MWKKALCLVSLVSIVGNGCNAANDINIASTRGSNSRRRLLGGGACDGDVDEFLFDAVIRVLGYRGTIDCNEEEVEDMRNTLTAAYQNVVHVDPCLNDVLELFVNICESPSSVGDVQSSRNLRFGYNGRGLDFSWRGSGKVRWWCRQRNNDTTGDFHRRQLGDYRTTSSMIPRQLVPRAVSGFNLWNTADESNPIFLRTVYHGGILDLQRYGDKLAIEVIIVDDTPLEKVVFDIDGHLRVHVERNSPYLLSGKRGDGTTFTTSPQLTTLGAHTIRATPYSATGTPLQPIAFSFLVVDSSADLEDFSTPASQEELIDVFEDNLSYYLTGAMNLKYFAQEGHCLERNLVYVNVDLVDVARESQTLCPVDEMEQMPSGQILVSTLPGKCLDVDNGSADNGAVIVANLCDPIQLSQQWTFIPVDDEYYQIKAIHSGKCMGVEEPSMYAEGAKLAQYPCSTERHMLWRPTWSGMEQSLVVKLTQYCLTVQSLTGDIQQNDCRRSRRDKYLAITAAKRYHGPLPAPAPSSLPSFAPTSAPTASPSSAPTSTPTFRPTSAPTLTPTSMPTMSPTPYTATDPSQPSMPAAGRIVSLVSGKCIDVEDESGSDGAQIIQYDCLGPSRLSQVWVFVPVDDEYYQIKASHSNKCMGVEDASLDNEADVVQLPCGMESHKLWRIVVVGIDQFIVVQHTDKCLDVFSPAVRENGAEIHQFTCFGVVNQIFEIQTDTPL